MSIFPFIDPETLAASQDNALPMFREYAYDYENNRLLLRDGQTYLVEGNEALRIWIFKALGTDRGRQQQRDPAGVEAVYHRGADGEPVHRRTEQFSI